MLRSLFESYSSAVDDPGDEFTHLYEIRDALSSHYGKADARRALGISKTESEPLRVSHEPRPVDQSRHRGKHRMDAGAATNEELADARRLVREWIIAFARTL